MIKEAKLMWLGKDGKIHYMDKETFDSIVKVVEKGTDIAIKVAAINCITLIVGGPTYAAGKSIAEGLQPVIDMIADCAEPITYGYMIKGFLKLTQGKEEEAKKVIQNAGTGFIGVKFIPQILRWLRELELFV